jgi:uncharacterized protein YcgL (UPF0745 family)
MTHANQQPLPCWIYRSSRKNEMYLYLAKEDGFEELPEVLKKNFGLPSLVMELELHADRALAREDVNRVMDNLRSQGFHLQLPPKLEPELYHGE